MAWAKVDDQWWSHPKVLGLSLEARGLWITALSWSCGQRKSRIPSALISMLEGWDHVDELVQAGLWIDEGNQFAIHDWSEYQDKSLSEKRSEAGRKGAEKRWQTDSKNQATDPVTVDDSDPEPDSKPIAKPVAMHGKGDGRYPSRPIPTHTSPKGDGLFEAFYEFWQGRPYESGVSLTKSERGRINAAAKEAFEAGIGPEQVRSRGERYCRDWPAMERTPQALLLHWSRFDGSSDPPAPFDPDNCQHPDDRRAVVDGSEYCGACGVEFADAV